MQSNSSALLLVNRNTQSIFKNMPLPSETRLEVRAPNRSRDGRKLNVRLEDLAPQDLPVPHATVLRRVMGLRSEEDTLPRKLLALDGFQNPGAGDETNSDTRAVGVPARVLERTVRVIEHLRNQRSDTMRFIRVRKLFPKISAATRRRAFVAAFLTDFPEKAADDQNQQP